MLAGTLTVGLPLSVTTTLNEALPVLPCESVALQVTPVVPSPNVLPEDGEQSDDIDPSTVSLADAEKVTVAPLALVADAVVVPGTLTVGSVVS